MKQGSRLLTVALAVAFTSGVAFAQGGDEGDGGDSSDLDVFIRVLPANADLPDAATREIELPVDEQGDPRPSEQGVEHGGSGLETANAAREDGRAFGQESAAAAQENREDVERDSRPDPEDLPDQVPDNPGPPDTPGPPETPPGGPPN